MTGESEYATLHKLANDLHRSRLWKTGSVEQALAVILMGRELGIGPTTALSNIIISAGKPTLGAALVGALIQKSGRYTYRVTEMTDQSVSVDFYERNHNLPLDRDDLGKLGTSTFTIQDAQRARLSGSQTWQQYPRNLLLARAMTNGARWYCPGVFGGVIYDPEELGIAGMLAPPEGVGSTNATPSAPASSPSEGATDVEFVPNGGAVTIEELLATWSAEEILEANGGDLPQTDADLERVAGVLHAREEAATGGGA